MLLDVAPIVPASGEVAASDHLQILMSATGQSSMSEALTYLAEGHFVDPALDRTPLMRAVCSVTEPMDSTGTAALQRLAKEASASGLDTSANLLRPELIVPPSTLKSALDAVASRTVSKTLADVDWRALRAAQRVNSRAVVALAAAAGMSWTQLTQRAQLTSPREPGGAWSNGALQRAFDCIDAVVAGQATRLPDTPGIPSRPIELLGDPDPEGPGIAGWATIEAFRSRGVPYEVLLAQRVSGGFWRIHRVSTGGKFSHAIAEQLCTLLDEAGIAHVRASRVGGPCSKKQINELVGGGGDQVAIVALRPDGAPSAVVGISIAQDGGSAAKSGARMRLLPSRVPVPALCVVAGLGWAGRNETAELARALDGHLYSERALAHVVSALAQFS